MRFRATEAEIRALNAYLGLIRSADRITTRLASKLSERKLTISQLEALEALLHGGSMCQRDLGKRLQKSGGNITLVVDNLEKRGYVRRKRQEKDRRFMTVELTSEGEETIRALFPVHLNRIVEEMGTLSRAEQDDLRKICRRLMGDAKA